VAAAADVKLPCPVHFPSPALSTDNAAMIALAAFPKLKNGVFADLSVMADASLRLA
jgi:N6-L-threonylcarbamoyladenine synthase